MSEPEPKSALHFDSACVHAGASANPTSALSTPIFQASTYAYDGESQHFSFSLLAFFLLFFFGGHDRFRQTNASLAGWPDPDVLAAQMHAHQRKNYLLFTLIFIQYILILFCFLFLFA